MKLDDYECRDNVNGRMIDHLNKTITLNKDRIRIAKKRYKELKSEVSKMKKKVNESDKVVVSRKKKKVVSKRGIEEAINYDILDSMDDEEESEDEEYNQIDKQCNVQLHFDCKSSRTSSGTST